MEVLSLCRYRLDCIRRGYIKKTQIKQFVPCGYEKAKKIFAEVMLEMDREGVKPVFDDAILTSRLLDYLGLKAANIEQDYAKELKYSAERKEND